MPNEEIVSVMQVNHQLEHELMLLQEQIGHENAFEIQKRDLLSAQLRRQEQLKAYIKHAKQILSEKNQNAR